MQNCGDKRVRSDNDSTVGDEVACRKRQEIKTGLLEEQKTLMTHRALLHDRAKSLRSQLAALERKIDSDSDKLGNIEGKQRRCDVDFQINSLIFRLENLHAGNCTTYSCRGINCMEHCFCACHKPREYQPLRAHRRLITDVFEAKDPLLYLSGEERMDGMLRVYRGLRENSDGWLQELVCTEWVRIFVRGCCSVLILCLSSAAQWLTLGPTAPQPPLPPQCRNQSRPSRRC